MGLYGFLASLPWPPILALGSILTVYLVYRRREDLFDRFGFGTREVTFLTLLPVAGWAVNFPFLVLGRSTLALNLGGAIVPILLSAWIVYKGYLDRTGLVVGAVGTAVTAVVAYEIVRFEPAVGIIAEFPWFFLPPLAASGVTLLLLAREDLLAVPAAYIAGSIGALIGADLLHMGEIGPYILSSQQVSVLSVGGAGAMDMVFLSGIVAMAFNLVLVAAVNPPTDDPAPGQAHPLAYPAGLALVHDPRELIVQVDKRRVAGRYVPPADRVRYRLAQADVALEEDALGEAVDRARDAVRRALQSLPDDRRRMVLSHPGLAADIQALVDLQGTAIDEATAEDAVTTAKLIVGALDRGGRAS